MTRVAFLGLGAMGRPMAARLLGAGHDLTVWNRTPGRDEQLVTSGARRAATPADAVRDAKVAVTMLADPRALEEVLFGPGGVAETISPDATLIDMSTVGPTAMLSAAARLSADVLDAPVLGSVPHAEAGTLTILAGGDPRVLDRQSDLLGVLGTIVRAGESGAGATLKLAANAAAISALVGLGEVLSFTDRTGMDPAVVLDGIGAGPLASLVERWRGRITSSVDDVNFTLSLASKDLGLILEEAGRTGIELTLPAAAAARFREAIEAGQGEADFTAVVAQLRG
jgi:3-hydroxyisobutyrate dehydrogenase-like beta-hydroxyacid dehydrogenase